MLRVTHALLSTVSHHTWLCVDDLLALLCKQSMSQQVTLITFFLASINAPMSWRKAQVGPVVTWCGWTFQIARAARVACSIQEASPQHLGLLMWATSTCTHLGRTWHRSTETCAALAALLWQTHARDWRRLLDAFSPQATIAKQPLGMWLTVGAQLMEVGSQKISCKADVVLLRVLPSGRA